MYTSEEPMLLFAWGLYVGVIFLSALGFLRFTLIECGLSGIAFTRNWFVRAIGAVVIVPLLGFVLWGVGWVMSKVGWFISSPIWSMFR